MKAGARPKAKPKQKDYRGAKSNLHELSEAAFVELVALGQNTTPTLSSQRHICGSDHCPGRPGTA